MKYTLKNEISSKLVEKFGLCKKKFDLFFFKKTSSFFAICLQVQKKVVPLNHRNKQKKQNEMKNLIESSKIERVARINDLTTDSYSEFLGIDEETLCDIEKEFFVVNLGNFRKAIFEVCQLTFDYSYSHTYDANTDKTTKRIPKIFK